MYVERQDLARMAPTNATLTGKNNELTEENAKLKETICKLETEINDLKEVGYKPINKIYNLCVLMR